MCTSMWYMNTICKEVTDDNSFLSIGCLPEPKFYRFIGAAGITVSNIFMLKKQY